LRAAGELGGATSNDMKMWNKISGSHMQMKNDHPGFGDSPNSRPKKQAIKGNFFILTPFLNNCEKMFFIYALKDRTSTIQTP
jgi:hypothetical protein